MLTFSVWYKKILGTVRHFKIIIITYFLNLGELLLMPMHLHQPKIITSVMTNLFTNSIKKMECTQSCTNIIKKRMFFFMFFSTIFFILNVHVFSFRIMRKTVRFRKNTLYFLFCPAFTYRLFGTDPLKQIAKQSHISAPVEICPFTDWDIAIGLLGGGQGWGGLWYLGDLLHHHHLQAAQQEGL